MERKCVAAILLMLAFALLISASPLLAKPGSFDPLTTLKVSIPGRPNTATMEGIGSSAPLRGASLPGSTLFLPFVATPPPCSPLSETTVQFSPDAKTVTVTFAGKTYTIPRPTTPPTQFTPVPGGKTIWVSTTGSDTNFGTGSSPFRTIAKAASAAATGDVIYVRGGTYVESVLIRTPGIVLSSAPGELGRVCVSPPASYAATGQSVIAVQAVRDVTINGLIIEGYRGWPGAPIDHYSANGITFENGGAGTASNNVIFHNVHCGIKEMDHGGYGIVMDGNVIFGNGNTGLDHGIYAPSDGFLIRGNVIFGNTGYGIHSYSAPQNQTIQENVTWGNGAGGLLIAGSHTRVYNNTVAYDRVGVLYYLSTSHDNDVRNNIFAFNGDNGAYDFGGPPPSYPYNNTDDYNAYFPRTSGDPSPLIPPGPNELYADPLFIDPAAGNFRLQPNSPARNRGIDVGLPFTGTAPSLGAYQ